MKGGGDDGQECSLHFVVFLNQCDVCDTRGGVDGWLVKWMRGMVAHLGNINNNCVGSVDIWTGSKNIHSYPDLTTDDDDDDNDDDGDVVTQPTIRGQNSAG